jgi:dTDP-L-rhamnose 4-epimerase
MKEKILVTGGAGFIGSHVVDLLLAEGYKVRVLDSLEKQVHGDTDKPPAYLSPDAEFLRGDIRDTNVLARSLQGIEAVVHLAAAVGVAQSQYEIHRYVQVNDSGTAALLQAVAGRRDRIHKVVVASSMSVYGEGRYQCPGCGPVAVRPRSAEQLACHEWELKCPDCGRELQSAPTDEDKPLFCESVYALTKKVTEELAMIVGEAYGIPTVALRFFNTYGPRQALSNPYTGLLAIAASRMLAGKPVLVFEDGKQSRDFIHVRDVARACLAALCWQGSGTTMVANIGTGLKSTVLDLVSAVRNGLGFKGEPEIKNLFRSGDIRHCYADTRRARESLGFESELSLEQGIPGFLDWARQEKAVKDMVEKAVDELELKGLVK